VDFINRKRREHAAVLIEKLRNIKGIRVVSGYDTAYSIYTRLPIICESTSLRERLYQALRRRGLGVSKSYPEAITRIEALFGNGNHFKYCNESVEVARTILTLPTHQFVNRRDIKEITQIIKETANE